MFTLLCDKNRLVSIKAVTERGVQECDPPLNVFKCRTNLLSGSNADLVQLSWIRKTWTSPSKCFSLTALQSLRVYNYGFSVLSVKKVFKVNRK